MLASDKAHRTLDASGCAGLSSAALSHLGVWLQCCGQHNFTPQFGTPLQISAQVAIDKHRLA
eukprot:348402-Amphidinium_carterae.2